MLSSLQRPRKLTVRGSDGKKYGLLCKPKDDLRKDQRLMEFNTMINRALKKDAETSKRQLCKCMIVSSMLRPLANQWLRHQNLWRDAFE